MKGNDRCELMEDILEECRHYGVRLMAEIIIKNLGKTLLGGNDVRPIHDTDLYRT